MAVPKRHLSKARRDKRRSNVWKLELRLLQGRGSHQEGLICILLGGNMDV